MREWPALEILGHSAAAFGRIDRLKALRQRLEPTSVSRGGFRRETRIEEKLFGKFAWLTHTRIVAQELPESESSRISVGLPHN